MHLESIEITCFILVLLLPCFTTVAEESVYQRLPLKSGVGPESFAFDCNGQGPYTGVSDGRILKWQGSNQSWTEFAVTSQNRRRDLCDGSNDPKLENLCGRPLGLQFNKKTCDLYIADAYFGLLLVGPKGGVATPLASSAEGVPFRFTNAVDVNQENGDVYFTDSSIWIQRWAFVLEIVTGDKTGRLMKYSPRTQEVTVLLRDIQMANGVALSKDSTYILVAETTSCRILRYWLGGPKARTSEVFTELPGHPDNIKRNRKGDYWVALNNGEGMTTVLLNDAVATRLDEEGNVLEVWRSSIERNLESVSEVEEYDGTLWIGSVVLPYVSVFKA